MSTFTELLYRELSLTVGAEAVIFDSIPEATDKGDISDLRYMISYTIYLKNTDGVNSVDVKVEVSPETISPLWIEENAYQTIIAGSTLVISGTTKDILALRVTAKETVASNPGILDAYIVYKQRR